MDAETANLKQQNPSHVQGFESHGPVPYAPHNIAIAPVTWPIENLVTGDVQR